jgi:hypothetical protein
MWCASLFPTTVVFPPARQTTFEMSLQGALPSFWPRTPEVVPAFAFSVSSFFHCTTGMTYLLQKAESAFSIALSGIPSRSQTSC